MFNRRKSIKGSINQQKKGFFLKEEISDFLIHLGQRRTDLQLDISQVVEKLKFPTRTVEELEKGNVCLCNTLLTIFFHGNTPIWWELNFLIISICKVLRKEVIK